MRLALGAIREVTDEKFKCLGLKCSIGILSKLYILHVSAYDFQDLSKHFNVIFVPDRNVLCFMIPDVFKLYYP